MAVTSAGELFGYDAPGVGETVEVPIVLTDSAGAVVTGITFDAAGMAVWYSKPGDTNYTAFPTFATENWRELLLGLGGAASGEYRLILRQSDAAELALLDTPGMMTFYVKCTATAGDRAIIKVNAADVARDDQWTDTRAGYVDELAAANLPADVDAILLDTGTAGVVVAATSKTGYALSAAGVQAIWDALSSALTTVGSIGKRLVDYVNAAIGDVKTKTDNLPASPAAVGSAMTLTTGERTAIISALLATNITFPDGSTKTIETIIEEVWADSAGNQTLSGTTWTFKWPDASTTAFSFDVGDASAPTQKVRN